MKKFASLEEQRDWEKQRREKYKATHIAWRERNREKLKLAAIDWRLENREKAREYYKKRYRSNANIREKTRNRSLKNSIKNRAPIDEWKKQGCQICGLLGPPIVFDAHHVDPTKKSFAISSYYKHCNKYVEGQLQAELAKCVCLCSNCHRLLHAGVVTLKKEANLALEPEYFI